MALETGLVQALKAFSTPRWWEIGASEESRKRCKPGDFQKACRERHEEMRKVYESAMANDSEQRWLRKVSADGTSADKVAALTMLIQLCPVFSTGYIKALLTMASKTARSDSAMAMDALKELLTGTLLPNRKLKTLEQMEPVSAKGLKKSTFTEICVVSFFEDYLKTAVAAFVQVLGFASQNTVAFIKTKAVRSAYELLSAKPEQEKALLSLLINKFGDSSGKVSSQVSFCIKELLKKHPGIKGPVVKEMEAFLARPNITQKSRYSTLLLLSEMIFGRSDGEVAARLVRLFVAQLELALKKPVLTKKEFRHKKRRGWTPKPKRKRQPLREEDNRIVRTIINGIRRATPYVDTVGGAALQPDTVEALFKVCHTVSAYSTRVSILSLLHRGLAAGDPPDRFYRLLYEQIGQFELFTSSHAWQAFLLLQRCVPGDASAARGLALARRLLQVSAGAEPPVGAASLGVLRDLVMARRTEIKPILHTVDSKIVISREEGADAEEEHFIDDDVAEAQQQEANPKEVPTQYDSLAREPRFARATNTPVWELQALTTHIHPSVGTYACKLLDGQTFQDMPANPFDVFSIPELLEQFAYHAKARRERAGKKAGEKVGQTIAVNSEKFLKRKKVQPHEKFFQDYFRDSSVRAEQDRKRKVRREKEEDFDEAGDADGEDADEFFDNYLKGQIPEGEDDDDDEDDGAFLDEDGEEEEGDVDGEEPEEESEDGAFCDVEDQEETEEPKTQSKRDKAKELRKRHKGGSMFASLEDFQQLMDADFPASQLNFMPCSAFARQLQNTDAVRAGHIDCVRLLAFAGASLGDSATDEDRTKLQQTFGEDFSSPGSWSEVQKFQRRMNDLQQRVARLLISVAKGRARPEVFDAEASTKFNRQLICAIFKQCPQLADGMLSFTKLLQSLEANGVAPLQTFLAFLQDSIDCMRDSRWWMWYSKQQGNQKDKEDRNERHHKSRREAKVEKSTGMITKLMVAGMGICNQLANVVMKAAKEIYQKVNWEVNTRRIVSKDYRLDEGNLGRRRERLPSGMESQKQSQHSRRPRPSEGGPGGRRRSIAGSMSPSSHRAPSHSGSRRSRLGEETEDPREPGHQPTVCVICVECMFHALGWDVDWTAPASANYGINAGAVKKKLEEVAMLLMPAQEGTAIELLDSMLEIHAPPMEAAAWRAERRAGCCVDVSQVFASFHQDEYLKPMSFPLALELAMFTVLGVIRTTPVNMDMQPSREKTLQRTDFLFLRSGLELAEQEVRGDIAKTRKEVIKQRENGATGPSKKVMNIGARFGNRIEPVSVGRILATQKDLPADDISAIIDIQDSHVHVTAKLVEDDSDDEGRRRADKKITRRKDDVHILSHESSFGVMSSERFQYNLLRYLLDFTSLQVDAIEEDERRRAARKVPMGMEQPETEEEVEDVYHRETLSSGEVIWLDEEILLDFEEMGSQAVGSEASTESLSSYERAQLASPAEVKRSPTSNMARRAAKRDASTFDRRSTCLARCWQWLQSRAAVCGGKEDQEAKLRQKMTWKFRELDEDGEGLTLADVATLLTDVLGHQLDRDAMLRLAANVYDTLERSEQELLQLTELQDCLETVTTGYEAMVKRQKKHSSQGRRGEDNSWPWVQRLAGYVMPMDSPYLLVWDFLKRLAAIYYLLEVPMRFCIINFDALNPGTAWTWLITNIVMDVFMFANVPLNFLRSYEEVSGVVVRDFEHIRRNYLLGAFSWDLIACLPFDIFADPSLTSQRTYATWRLLKLIHLRHLNGRRHDSKSSDRREHGFLLTTFIIVLQLFVLLHFMACIFWYLGNGWPSLQELVRRRGDFDIRGWFMVYEGMQVEQGSMSQPEVPVLNQYLLSVYIMVVIVTNDSNYLASPSSWVELFWLLVSFVISVAVMGNVDGTLVGKVISQDESIVEQRVMRARIDTFIKNSGLPPDLVDQIRMSAGADGDMDVHDLAVSNKTQKAADVRIMESVLANLSYSLLQRVGRRVFLKWLQALPIFKDCSDPFLLHLATTCRLLTSSAGAFVCRAGEPTSYFVVLKNGSAQLRDLNSEEVDRVDERGTALCDISCLFGLRHEVSIVSEEDSVFVKVPLEQLNHALSLYPKDHEVIHNNVLKLTPDPSPLKIKRSGQWALELNCFGMWGEEEDDMAKSQASHTSRRRRKRKEGGVDLVAELTLHDLSLEGVAKVRKLIKQFQKTQEQERIGDFIAYAAQGKLEQMEAMLRSNKVSVSCVNWDMRTALHVAVSNGHVSIVEKSPGFGHTPLDDAVRERHAEVAEFLIEASAEFKGGVSAAVQLCEAAASGETAQLELLVDVIGVDPNLGDYDARTALHLAASNGHLETITKMLEFGNLDLSPLDRFGQTPLDDAIRHQHVAVQRLLKSEGAQMGKVEFGVALCEAASQNDLGKIRQMIEAGVRAGMADYDYRTALHLACSNGHLETCVFLLREGKVDPNPLDRFLNTPMDDAIRHEQHDVVQLLVKYRGRPSQDEELQGGVRNEFINMMEEEGNRKDADKLEKELKTNGFAEVLEKIVKLRSDIENEVHQFVASATNIRYCLCRILHMAMIVSDDSARGKSELEGFMNGYQDESTTVQRLRYLMDKDMKSLDITAAKIIQHLEEERLGHVFLVDAVFMLCLLASLHSTRLHDTHRVV
ncbi:Cebpz [Symbiodinium natans]|uniref:Cebpz protein n=1 Tax=Symbiodinium natans TaxID=878477 RepID=A0A812MNG5_9DINO|nr:Cebpz [Symbiodinium natans]